MRKSPKLWTTKQRRSVSFLLCLGIQRNPMSKGELITLLLLKMRIPGNKKRSGSGPLPWDSWATNGPVAAVVDVRGRGDLLSLCCPVMPGSRIPTGEPNSSPLLWFWSASHPAVSYIRRGAARKSGYKNKIEMGKQRTLIISFPSWDKALCRRERRFSFLLSVLFSSGLKSSFRATNRGNAKAKASHQQQRRTGKKAPSYSLG